MLIAPLGVIALSLQAYSARAADIVDTLEEQQQFSRFAEAIESAGLAQSLQGEGPYTVFAPTDQAFDQLPRGAVDSLQEDQLKALLQYHVVEGEAIEAEDALGQHTKVDTLAGDSLSIDGTGEMVLLVPAGLALAGSGQQAETETQVSEEGDMPASEHQQQVMATKPGTEQQQTMPQDTAMPASPHQEQLLKGKQGEQQSAMGEDQSQSGQQAETETQVSEEGDMPASEHQRQVMATKPGTEQRQTMPQDTAMPASRHQEQLLKGKQEKGMLREATVVEPDIMADNGVIHAIDRVLVPQAVLSKLEGMPGQ
ncbi:MAG: fasciclin domain-containing protein [Gemmatimonadota bacterium]